MDTLAQLQLALASVAQAACARRDDLAQLGAAVRLLQARIGVDASRPGVAATKVALRPDPVRSPEAYGLTPHDSAAAGAPSTGPWTLLWPSPVQA